MDSSIDDGNRINFGEQGIPRSFTRRLILLVNLVFLLTMMVFLVISFWGERGEHYNATFAHLEETLGVLSGWEDLSPDSPSVSIHDLESRLSEHTGVPHRLFVVADGKISASSEEQLLGSDYRAVIDLDPYGGMDQHRGMARVSGSDWLVSFRSVGDSGLFLLRSRSASENFVSRFVALHGLHLLITILAFVLLLKLSLDRYVRRPIEHLAQHVQRVERGEFRTALVVSGDDEFAWLGQRFTDMGSELNKTVERLVRSEKFSSVSAVTFRVARELTTPLERLERHIVELEGVAQQQPDLRRLADQMRRDRESLLSALRHLGEIEPPEDL